MCVEEPVAASCDALPCGWPNLYAWLDDVELSFNVWRQGPGQGKRSVNPTQRIIYYTSKAMKSGFGTPGECSAEALRRADVTYHDEDD